MTVSARGQRRREALLGSVADDIARNGLVGFSLRRAAKAAGTTHKVLLYHFETGDELLREALRQLRDARLRRTDAHARATDTTTLGERVRAAWEALRSEDDGPRVLDQATAFGLLDPERYSALAQDATEQYLPLILDLLPPSWTCDRREQVGALILAALRGLLVDALTSGEAERASAGVDALTRMLDLEEARVDSEATLSAASPARPAGVPGA